MIPLWLTGMAQGVTSALGTPEEQRARRDRLTAEAESQRRWEADYGLRKSQIEAQLTELIRQQRDREEQKRALGGAADILERPIPTEIQQAMKTPAAAPGSPDYGGGEEAFALPPERVTSLMPASPERRAAAGLVRAGTAIPEYLARLLGMQKPDLVNLAPGHVAFDPQKGMPVFTAPTTEKHEEYTLPDGSRWRVNADGMREMVSGPLKSMEKPAQRLGLENEYLGIKKTKPVGPYTPYENLVIKQYDAQRAKRERGMTMVDLALEEAGGDPAKAIAIIQRGEQRSKEGIERRATFLWEIARRNVEAALSPPDKVTMTQAEFDARMRPVLQRLIQGESEEVQDLISSKAGLPSPKRGPQTTPPSGRAATRAEVENAKRQVGGDPQRARQLLIQQGIDPTLPVVQ